MKRSKSVEAELRTAAPLGWQIALAGLLVVPSGAHAEIPVVHEVFTAFQNASDLLSTRTEAALATPDVGTIVHALFAAFALGLFVSRFARMALRGYDMLHILELMFTIFFVYMLLTAYRTVFPAIMAAGRNIGDVLSTGITSADGKMTVAEALVSQLTQMTFRVACGGFWDCVRGGLIAFIATLVGYVLVVVLALIATIVEVWTLWSFHVAYAVGWVAMPFLLVERLSFVFDGWLRFFFSVVVYSIVAKVVLALVLLSFKLMATSAPGSTTATIDVHKPLDLAALFIFLMVGIYALVSTGRFASAITGGAPGIGGMMQSVASRASRTVRGGGK